MRKYPNILVINNQSIYNNNATGITLRSILGAWPKDNLYEMHMDKDADFQDAFGKKHSSNIIESVPVYHLMRRLHSTLGKKKEDKKGTSAHKNGVSKSTSQGAAGVLNCIADASPVSIKINWNKYLNDFVPDIIYTCGGSVSVMKIALKAARKYQVPIVLHFMDDWAHYLQNEHGWIRQSYKKKIRKWLKKCYAKSVLDFAISPYMAADYEAETGILHIPLMNAVSVQKFSSQPESEKETHIFTYAGGLHLERWKALKEIEEILGEFNQKGHQFKLRIYTNLKNNPQVQYFDSATTEIFEAVPHEEIDKVLKEADVLVHTETQSPALMGFFRYSISTKIPEYMAANRPILFYGPKQMRLLQYLKEHEMAFTAENQKELRKCIEEIAANKDKAEGIRKNAYDYVIENHDLAKVQETFYLTICSILEGE